MAMEGILLMTAWAWEPQLDIRRAEATDQVMRDKTKTWSGMVLATQWLWLISALT
ncbi:hypothetical protein GCM10008986_33040 [Salinibacillus aidingensis]|uniref:Uncharacterized protein n=1 Tax=Salinibacillus aidingensis TaxID=237684 RepID=A0ABN1BPX8_9BACI